MNESFSNRMRTVEASQALSKNIEKVENELKLITRSFNKNDLLRVSNSLLAAGRTADAVSRQSFIESLSQWCHTLENGLTKDELKRFVSNFQLMLEREHDKHRLEVKLASIQSNAEKGFVFREEIAKSLRNLADEVESGEYPVLLASLKEV